MKKIFLVLTILLCVCCSCFANEEESFNWISCGSKWEFSGNKITEGIRDNSMGFGDDLHYMFHIRKSTSNVITYGLVHFKPKSLNPNLFTVVKMSKFIISTGKMRDINPPNPASFDDPVLAKAVCDYIGIGTR